MAPAAVVQPVPPTSNPTAGAGELLHFRVKTVISCSKVPEAMVTCLDRIQELVIPRTRTRPCIVASALD